MLRNEERLTVSPYAQLYDILVPEDHILRKINTLVDFSFVYDEIKKNYTVDFGRKAADPVYMLKLLLLKILNPLSDRDLCERARYDISFKYFLGIAPEDPIVDDSLLSKFRRQRLKDTNILVSASSRIEQLTPINFEHFRSQTCSDDVSFGS